MRKVFCPECGGHLVYESFGQYGDVQRIGFNGKIQKKSVRIHYGGGDAAESLVYCQSCGWNSNGKFVHQGQSIKLEDEEDDQV